MSMSVCFGGTIRYFVKKSAKDNSEMLEKRKEQGILLGSGLIAGEGIMGVLIAAYAFFAGKPQGIGWAFHGTFGEFVALGVFALLGFYLVRKTRG